MTGTAKCPACLEPIEFNNERGWYHVDMSASNCSGVRDIPWPTQPSGETGAQKAVKELLKFLANTGHTHTPERTI